MLLTLVGQRLGLRMNDDLFLYDRFRWAVRRMGDSLTQEQKSDLTGQPVQGPPNMARMSELSGLPWRNGTLRHPTWEAKLPGGDYVYLEDDHFNPVRKWGISLPDGTVRRGPNPYKLARQIKDWS